MGSNLDTSSYLNGQIPISVTTNFKIKTPSNLRPYSVADTRMVDAETEASIIHKLKVKNDFTSKIGNDISAGGYTIHRGTGVPTARINKVKLDISMVDASPNNSIITVTPSSEKYMPYSKHKSSSSQRQD